MGKMNEDSVKSTKTKNVTPAVTPWGKNRVKNTEGSASTYSSCRALDTP